MSPSPNTEARKRRDEKATPEPLVFPRSFILTTMERVRQVGSGQVASVVSTAQYVWYAWDFPRAADDDTIVLWRPSPPRKVTIELDEDVAQRWADGRDVPSGDDPVVIVGACRAALDGDK
jgi:hypothetical protein